jgi:hypothetical protein
VIITESGQISRCCAASQLPNADSVLEDRQVQASRTARISAIPVRQSEPARKGASRRVGVGKKKGAVLQAAVTCGLNWQYVASRRTSPHIRHNRTKAAVGKPGPNRDFFRGATRVPSYSCADHETCILIPPFPRRRTFSATRGRWGKDPRKAGYANRRPNLPLPRPAATGFADLCLAKQMAEQVQRGSRPGPYGDLSERGTAATRAPNDPWRPCSGTDLAGRSNAPLKGA